MNEELNPDVQNAPDVLESPVVVEAEAEMPNYSVAFFTKCFHT